MKKQHIVKLTGYIKGEPAKTHQADDVVLFTADGPNGTPGYFQVDHSVEGTPMLRTPKGEYPLVWSRSGAYYEPKEDIGIKIHITLKKIVGLLIYWA